MEFIDPEKKKHVKICMNPERKKILDNSRKEFNKYGNKIRRIITGVQLEVRIKAKLRKE